MMMEHIHRCLFCRPDMVPDFDRNDPCYHDGEKCRTERGFNQVHRVTLDGVPIAYTSGHFEGREGWVLFVGVAVNRAHSCLCGSHAVCVEPCFGIVTSEHVEVAD